MKILEIDGSKGGGQILRTSLSLSMITGKPFRIKNIRMKRQNPGLRPQHLNAVKAFMEISNSKARNLRLNSEEIEFYPGEMRRNHLTLNIGTAGSTILVIQTLLPFLIWKNKEFRMKLTGGTDTKFAPTSSYFHNVFLNFLEKIGLNFSFKIYRYGFYPKGNGVIEFHYFPSEMEKLNFDERGNLKYIFVEAVASEELKNKKVGDRLIEGFISNFLHEMKIESQIKYVKTDSTGCFIQPFIEFENYRIGCDFVCDRGIKSEDIGKRCSKILMEDFHSDGVDRFASDQLMIYLALLKGKYRFCRFTEHMETNKEVIEKFLDIKLSTSDNIMKILI